MKADISIKNTSGYPKLMKFKNKSDVVWLFFNNYNGLIIASSDKDLPLGRSEKGFSIEEMEEFNGTVTLEN